MVRGGVRRRARQSRKSACAFKSWGEKLAAGRAEVAKLKKAGASAADISTAEGKLAATEASEKGASQAYRALPEEVDAWKVGEDAAAAFPEGGGKVRLGLQVLRELINEGSAHLGRCAQCRPNRHLCRSMMRPDASARLHGIRCGRSTSRWPTSNRSVRCRVRRECLTRAISS